MLDTFSHIIITSIFGSIDLKQQQDFFISLIDCERVDRSEYKGFLLYYRQPLAFLWFFIKILISAIFFDKTNLKLPLMECGFGIRELLDFWDGWKSQPFMCKRSTKSNFPWMRRSRKIAIMCYLQRIFLQDKTFLQNLFSFWFRENLSDHQWLNFPTIQNKKLR